MDIGLKQREAHVAQRVIDIGFGDLPLTPQPLKGQLELIG
jgi:hypothetical protein